MIHEASNKTRQPKMFAHETKKPHKLLGAMLYVSQREASLPVHLENYKMLQQLPHLDMQPPLALTMSQSTSLLDLPPELRLLIFEHLIGPAGRIYISFKKRGTRIQVLPLHGSTGDGHGLLLVCRQIRGEFLPIYIGSAVGSARVIVTPVKNFSFNRVQRFLALYKDKVQPATNPSLSYGDFYDKEDREYVSIIRYSLKSS